MQRRWAGLSGFAMLSSLLVHGAGSDLLGPLVVGSPFEQTFLDVLVLPLSFFAPRAVWHRKDLLAFFLDNARANPFD